MLISIFVVLLGLAFGSFLNVCITRLPRHESVVAPRSRCPRCLTPILNRDNVPVLGWLLLRGRCRSCGARIPIRYPLIELATPALFLLCWLRTGEGFYPFGIEIAVFCWLLLGLAAMDAETLLLPDAFTLPGIVLGVLVSYQGGPSEYDRPLKRLAMSVLWAAFAAALVLLIRGLYWLARRREGIGLGDAKLLAMIAAWLGPWQAVLVLFLAAICATAYGLVLIAWVRTRRSYGKLTARIPLGAFLSAAGILAVFEGDSILRWYLGLLR